MLTKSTLTIQRKQLQASIPIAKTPRKQSPLPEEQLKEKRELESVQSDCNSMRRESLGCDEGSQRHHPLNPTMTEMGPEIVIVNQKKKKRAKARQS